MTQVSYHKAGSNKYSSIYPVAILVGTRIWPHTCAAMVMNILLWWVERVRDNRRRQFYGWVICSPGNEAKP